MIEPVLKDKGLSGNSKIVYSVLRSFHGDAGTYPSIVQLSEAAGMSKGAIQTALARLSERGYIEIEKPTGADKWSHKRSSYFFTYNAIIIEHLAGGRVTSREPGRQDAGTRTRPGIEDANTSGDLGRVTKEIHIRDPIEERRARTRDKFDLSLELSIDELRSSGRRPNKNTSLETWIRNTARLWKGTAPEELLAYHLIFVTLNASRFWPTPAEVAKVGDENPDMIGETIAEAREMLGKTAPTLAIVGGEQ